MYVIRMAITSTVIQASKENRLYRKANGQVWVEHACVLWGVHTRNVLCRLAPYIQLLYVVSVLLS